MRIFTSTPRAFQSPFARTRVRFRQRLLKPRVTFPWKFPARIYNRCRAAHNLEARGRDASCLQFLFCIAAAIIVYTSRVRGGQVKHRLAARTHTARGYVRSTSTCTHTHSSHARELCACSPSLGFYASGSTSNDGAGLGEQLRTSALSNLRAHVANEFPSGFRKLDFNP